MLFFLLSERPFAWYLWAYTTTFGHGVALRFVQYYLNYNFDRSDFGELSGLGMLFQTLFVIFALTGGCTGSTAGSVKIFRWQVVWAYLKQSMITAVDPNRVVPVKVKQYTIDPGIISSVLVFVMSFFGVIMAVTLLLAFTGLDFATAFSAAVATVTNSGPGIVASIGPDGNYASLSVVAKYALMAAMLLGRLEVLTVLVVFTKNFWRK